MEQFKQYRRKSISEMRPYINNEDLSGVSISDVDKANGSPKAGDMIARNPKNHNDQWLVAKEYFEDNLESMKEHKISDADIEAWAEKEIPLTSSSTLNVQRMRWIQGAKAALNDEIKHIDNGKSDT